MLPPLLFLIHSKESHMMKKVVFGFCLSMSVTAYTMDCPDEKEIAYPACGVVVGLPITEGQPVYMSDPSIDDTRYASIINQYAQFIEAFSSLINSGETNLNYFQARLKTERAEMKAVVPDAYVAIHARMVSQMSWATQILNEASLLSTKRARAVEDIVKHLSFLVATFGSAFKSY